MTLVAGADVTKGRWVVVVLRDGAFDRATVTNNLADFLVETEGLEVLAVDIPIGFPEGKEHRQCDLAAKRFLKPRSSSVFFTPPRLVIAEPTYAKANRLSKREFDRGISAQAYALRTKILEVDPIAACEDRIIEVHPEVCFRAEGRASRLLETLMERPGRATPTHRPRGHRPPRPHPRCRQGPAR